MAARKNPVERRLDRIHDAWVEFAENPEARMLCLVLAPDENSMVSAFIAKESHERAGELPDLFVQLSSPFAGNGRYGFSLREEFVAQARALHTGLGAPDKPAWLPPAPQPRESDLAAWLASLVSFAAHYALPGCLATVLTPDTVANPGAFLLWLQQLIARLPARLRIVTLDDARAPGFQPLVKAEPARVLANTLDLDMAGARLEISQEAGGLNTPGGQFRHLFVQLSNALGAGKLKEAGELGQKALAITAAQSWFALAVPIHFALGAALAGAQRSEEAQRHYEAAELVAVKGENAGDAVCKQLRVQARMARGGLLVGIRHFAPAAELFLETLPLALAIGDARMAFDCHRLASFSYEQGGSHERAWQTGVDGLTYAKTLDPQTRATSTLPYLGEGMLRLSERPEYQASRSRLEREMAGLVGRPEWRPSSGSSNAPTPNGAGPAA